MKSILILICFLPMYAFAESAKITVHFPNNEEKIFRFSPKGSEHKLDLGTKISSGCMVVWGVGSETKVKYFEMTCSPRPNQLKNPKNTLMYTAKVACGPSGFPALMQLNDGPKAELYSIQMECENE